MRVRNQWLPHRGVLVGAALVALVAASSAIAVWATYRLPAPEDARGRDLIRWLVTRDLRIETQTTCRALVRQLEIYLQDSQDIGAAATELNDRHRTMLAANVDVLLPEWLGLSVERYRETEPARRPGLLDQQLLLVERVGEMSRLWSAAASTASASSSMLQLVAKVERIVAEAPPAERAELDAYVRAMKLRWFTTVQLSEFERTSLTTIASHVVTELRGGLRLGQSESEFDPVRSRQLWRNVDLLAEVWFHRQVDLYGKVRLEERPRHMNALVADVLSWPLVERQLQSPQPTATSFANPLALLTNNPLAHMMKQMSDAERRAEGWIERAPRESQPAMREFVADARSAIQKRYLKKLAPAAQD